MNVLTIAWKDLQILIKDRGTIIYLFVMPLVFIVMLAGLFSASQSQASQQLALPVVNLDPDGAMAQTLVTNLSEAGGLQVVEYGQAEAESLLADKQLPRVLTIPEGFTAAVEAAQPITLTLVNGPDANDSQTQSVLAVVDGVTRDLSIQAEIIASLRQMGDMQTSPEAVQAFSPERAIAQARTQFEQSRTNPLVSIEAVQPGSLGSEDKPIDPVPGMTPGFTVLFVFLAAQATAQSIYNEKKIGSFRRLLAAPLSKTSLLLGKMLPNFIVGLLQVVVLFAASVILWPVLGLGQYYLGRDPLALVLLSLALALCSTGLGTVIAALARTEGQIGGLSTLLLWVMGMIGGSILPVFMLSDVLESISKITPHYWAIQGYYDLLLRGRDLSAVIPEIAALLVFALVFFGIGVWRFDFD
jgi:ABC-2 type transport system permease protein